MGSDSIAKSILAEAIQLWTDLTGVKMSKDGFSYGPLDVPRMNKVILEAQELDDSGVSALLILEAFVRSYLEQRTFTAAEIIKDYEAMTDFLAKVRHLFSLVQGDVATEHSAAFRNRIAQGLERYGADTQEALEMARSSDVVGFLRRDALKSMQTLKAYQFLAGKPDANHPQVIRKIYLSYSINDLLIAARDMPVSGIAVVLMRDASNAGRSYFCFVMRNGENVTIFTDKAKAAYPGQEDVLLGRSGRMESRGFAERANAHHFPYQIIPTSFDEKGETVFDADRTLSFAGQRLHPMMDLGDLPAHQSIWLTMMLALISERFWRSDWKADALSYTGAMIQRADLLVSSSTGDLLPVAQDYEAIELADITPRDLSAQTLDAQLDRASAGVNLWLEQRFGAQTPLEVLNVWQKEHDEVQLLEVGEGKAGAPEASISRFDAGALQSGPSWDRPKGTQLRSHSAASFGTQDELVEDRLYIARHNQAVYVASRAEEEFSRRKPEIIEWFNRAVTKNLPNLLAEVAGMELNQKNAGFMSLREKGASAGYSYEESAALNFCGFHTTKTTCWATSGPVSFEALFRPACLDDLCFMTGKAAAAVPDVLHAWTRETPYLGNPLLSRLDPMDHLVKNPWSPKRLNLNATIHLSKRGMARIKQGNYDAV